MSAPTVDVEAWAESLEYAIARVIEFGARERINVDKRLARLRALASALPGMGKDSERTRGVYVASRSKHGATWRRWRDDGFPIASTWIDESGEGETSDWPDLWSRCVNEARTADACVLYAPLDDGELKGALIEVGGALSAGRPVYFVGDGTARRYSWLAHPRVVQCDDIEEAFALALSHTRAIDAARAAQPQETSADEV